MVHIRAASALALAALTSGCTVYQRPAPLDPGVPKASLHIIHDIPLPAGSHWSGWQTPECSGSPQLLGATYRLRTVRFKPEETVELPAGKTIYMLVRGDTEDPNSNLGLGCNPLISSALLPGCIVNHCRYMVEVTPVAGRTYRAHLKMQAVPFSCQLNITDEATGMAPAEFKPLDVAPSCVK